MNNEFGQYGEMNNAWTSDDAKGLSFKKCAKHIFISK
jgi:hypothetical protein